VNPYESAAAAILAVALLSARIGTALAVFPIFAAGALPMSVRATVVAGLVLNLLPAVGLHPLMALVQQGGVSMAMLLAKEVAIGFGLGFVGSMGFWAVRAAGTIIENQAGLSMAATIDPLSAEEDSLVGGLFVQVLSVLFLVSGGLLALLGVLYESFRVWPLAELSPRLEPELWLQAAGQSMRLVGDLALRVAAPFVLLMLMAELGLAMLGRYAPQLNVFFLALPLKTALLLVLLFIYISVLADAPLVPDVAATIRGLFPRS
jgi:type III secretion protein T